MFEMEEQQTNKIVTIRDRVAAGIAESFVNRCSIAPFCFPFEEGKLLLFSAILAVAFVDLQTDCLFAFGLVFVQIECLEVSACKLQNRFLRPRKLATQPLQLKSIRRSFLRP